MFIEIGLSTWICSVCEHSWKGKLMRRIPLLMLLYDVTVFEFKKYT